MAHVVGLLEQRAAIALMLRRSGLPSGEARALARVALANYFAGALLMPYGRFLDDAWALRYDLQRLNSAMARASSRCATG